MPSTAIFLSFSSTNVQTLSAGTSATIFAECQNTILGADEIGKIGKRAEKVGKDTAISLVSSINSGKAFDRVYRVEQR